MLFLAALEEALIAEGFSRSVVLELPGGSGSLCAIGIISRAEQAVWSYLLCSSYFALLVVGNPVVCSFKRRPHY